MAKCVFSIVFVIPTTVTTTVVNDALFTFVNMLIMIIVVYFHLYLC